MQNRVPGRLPNDLVGTAEITLALDEMAQALKADEVGSLAWRWQVRRSLGALRDVLESEPVHSTSWLSARADSNQREGGHLLLRLQALGPRVLQDPDVTSVAHELERMVGEVQRHFQRVNDLVYDEVEIELGGSE